MGQTFSVNICSVRPEIMQFDSFVEYFSKLGVDGPLGCTQAEGFQLAAQKFERPQGGGPNSQPRKINLGQLGTIPTDGGHYSRVHIFQQTFVVYRDSPEILALPPHHPIEETRGDVFSLGPTPILVLEVEMANHAMGQQAALPPKGRDHLEARPVDVRQISGDLGDAIRG